MHNATARFIFDQPLCKKVTAKTVFLALLRTLDVS